MKNAKPTLFGCFATLVATVALLTACSSPTGSSGSGSGTDTSLPEVSVSDTWIQEGDSGTPSMAFTVSLSTAPATGTDLSVDYSTADGSATAGEDYEAGSGTVVFSSTDPLSKEIEVAIYGDTTVEYDETFQLVLSNVENGTVAQGIAVGTIVSDDQTVTILDDYPAPGDSPNPRGIVYDGFSLWVGEWTDQMVYQVNPENGSTLPSFDSGYSSYDLAWDGSRIWVDSGIALPPSLFRYSTTGSQDHTVSLGNDQGYPTAIAYDSSKDRLWLANTGLDPFDTSANRLWVLDPSDGSVLDSWEPSGGVPAFTYGMDLDDDPGFLWICYSNTVRKISIADRTTVKEFSVPFPANLLGGIYQVAPGEFWLTEINNKKVIRIKVEG